MASRTRLIWRLILALGVCALTAGSLPGAAAADDPAVAVNDSATTTEDSGAIHIDVLANDTDTDGGVFVVTGVSGGVKGTPSIGAGGGDVIYEPDPNASGLDQFTYTITGGSTATVHIGIHEVNDPPTAVDDTFEVVSGWGWMTLDILWNDSYAPDDYDVLSIELLTLPQHGNVAVYYHNSFLKYLPDYNYVGSDSFTYTVRDGHGATDTASVSIEVVKDTVGPVAKAPFVRINSYEPMGSSSLPTRVYWRAYDSNGSGVASFQLQKSVSGGSFTTVPLPAPLADRISQNLTVGRTHQFRIRARDRAGNWGSWATGPSFTVKLYQETTSLATYHGSWRRSYQSNALGGSTYRTSQAGASVAFHFTGTDLAIVGTLTTASGTARIYVDGNSRGNTVYFRSSKTAWREIVDRYHLAPGLHTIVIKAVGNGRIDIDAFAVMR